MNDTLSSKHIFLLHFSCTVYYNSDWKYAKFIIMNIIMNNSDNLKYCQHIRWQIFSSGTLVSNNFLLKTASNTITTKPFSRISWDPKHRNVDQSNIRCSPKWTWKFSAFVCWLFKKEPVLPFEISTCLPIYFLHFSLHLFIFIRNLSSLLFQVNLKKQLEERGWGNSRRFDNYNEISQYAYC